MGAKWRRWGIGLAGWLVSPALAWGAVTGIAGLVWALIAGLPTVVVALIALGALTVGVALAHLALSLIERLQHRHDAEAPNPCGNPKFRRRLIAKNAEPLASNLENFKYWWRAVEDQDFDGRLPTEDGGEGLRTTHAEAMQILLHRFAQFFSAAYTYEKQCPDHRPLKPMQKLYRVLGDDQGGPTDYGVTPVQLQVLAIRSTPGWGTAEARPIEFADFQVPIENDPLFIKEFRALREFLCEAGPDTEARARLEATAKAVRRVEERLTKNALQRAFRVLPRLWARVT